MVYSGKVSLSPAAPPEMKPSIIVCTQELHQRNTLLEVPPEIPGLEARVLETPEPQCRSTVRSRTVGRILATPPPPFLSLPFGSSIQSG